MSWVKDILEWFGVMGIFKKRPVSDQLLVQQLYRGMLEDQQKKFDSALSEIKEHRKRHKENGIELDGWEKREYELHQQVIGYIDQIRDLKEIIIFKNIEIAQFKKVIVTLYNKQK